MLEAVGTPNTATSTTPERVKSTNRDLPLFSTESPKRVEHDSSEDRNDMAPVGVSQPLQQRDDILTRASSGERGDARADTDDSSRAPARQQTATGNTQTQDDTEPQDPTEHETAFRATVRPVEEKEQAATGDRVELSGQQLTSRSRGGGSCPSGIGRLRGFRRRRHGGS